MVLGWSTSGKFLKVTPCLCLPRKIGTSEWLCHVMLSDAMKTLGRVTGSVERSTTLLSCWHCFIYLLYRKDNWVLHASPTPSLLFMKGSFLPGIYRYESLFCVPDGRCRSFWLLWRNVRLRMGDQTEGGEGKGSWFGGHVDLFLNGIELCLLSLVLKSFVSSLEMVILTSFLLFESICTFEGEI